MNREVPVVTRRSSLNIQVCVPKDWTDEQIVEFANREELCGTQHGWGIRKQGHELLTGCDERVKCEDRPNFVHIMLDA